MFLMVMEAKADPIGSKVQPYWFHCWTESTDPVRTLSAAGRRKSRFRPKAAEEYPTGRKMQ